MRRALFLCRRHLSTRINSNPYPIPSSAAAKLHYIPRFPFAPFSSSSNFSSSSSSGNDSITDNNPDPSNDPEKPVLPPKIHLSDADYQKIMEKMDVKDVDNKELKSMLEKYFFSKKKKLEEFEKTHNEAEELPAIFEAILRRRLTGEHEQTDDELMDELEVQPVDEVDDADFESDFEEIHDTDSDIDDLYEAGDLVQRRMAKNEIFNMDDKKWDEMIKEATAHGFLTDMTECEQVLEDMLNWDKLLPDEIKKKVEKKFDEIGDRVEKGELDVNEGYALFKEFEDEMVAECIKLMDAEGPPQFDETAVPDKKKDLDDPPGEGPILRWQTRVVFAPGGDAWHPKNRKVKLSVTVKELGMSKHQFRRLRDLAGKRYHSGKDELTIISERFEHREENRKDCLRTLFSLIEEAGKANKLVENALTSHLKEKLKSDPRFMERLNAKKMRALESSVSPA